MKTGNTKKEGSGNCLETMNESIIGQKFRVMPAFTYSKEPGKKGISGKKMTGTCVYVHPNGRFAVLEFAFKIGEVLREAFRPEDLRL